jgi:hypothetical protein
MGTIQINKTTLIKIGIGLLSFAIFILFGKFISEAGNCWGGFTAECWSRWDSALYLDVAQHGHNLFHCPDYPESWCGNAGWAPAYPILISIIHFMFPSVEMPLIGIYLSHFFVLASIVLIGIWLPNLKWHQYLLANLAFIFASGNIYLHAIFPMSMLVFCLLLLFYFLDKSQFILAGIFAFIAVLTYSIGFILVLCLGIWYLHDFFYVENRKVNSQKLFLVLSSVAGITTWFVYDYVVTGHWNALFLIQFKYGHSFNMPWKHMATRYKDLIQHWGTMDMWNEIQNFFLWILVLSSCVFMSLKKNRRPNWIFYFMFTFLFLAVPYSTSAITAIFRNAIVLAPIWIYLSQKISWKLSVFIILLFVLVSYPMGILFIQSRII